MIDYSRNFEFSYYRAIRKNNNKVANTKIRHFVMHEGLDRSYVGPVISTGTQGTPKYEYSILVFFRIIFQLP